MSKIEIKRESFSPNGIKNEYGDELGLVEVTSKGKTELLKALRTVSATIYVAGFVGRYVTSQKPWLASLYLHNGVDFPQASFGRDDRSGRFNKMNAISYEPETYAKLCNPKLWVAAQFETTGE